MCVTEDTAIKRLIINMADVYKRQFHDSKWTSEALFNLLDNAVKYLSLIHI